MLKVHLKVTTNGEYFSYEEIKVNITKFCIFIINLYSHLIVFLSAELPFSWSLALYSRSTAGAYFYSITTNNEVGEENLD